ncbi:unnamed protein product, partial [Vitis vinifera]
MFKPILLNQASIVTLPSLFFKRDFSNTS